MNRKLTAMNKLLMEENDRLQKQVSQLVYENSYFRQQTPSVKKHLSFYNRHIVLDRKIKMILFLNISLFGGSIIVEDAGYKRYKL